MLKKREPVWRVIAGGKYVLAMDNIVGLQNNGLSQGTNPSDTFVIVCIGEQFDDKLFVAPFFAVPDSKGERLEDL